MKLSILGFILSILCLISPERDSAVKKASFPQPHILSDTIKPANSNEQFLVVDTIVTYNPASFEEKVKIKTYYVPLKEYKAIQRKKKRKAKRRSRKKLIEVRDTCIVFNPATFEENITISTRKFTKKEYKNWLKSQKIN